jgi:anti-sigma factor RsiW
MTNLECKQIFAMLSEYLDRELPADLCETIDAHIAGCPPCVEFVKSLEKTVAYCRGAGTASDGPRPLSSDKLEELRQAYERSVPTVILKSKPVTS